ncbi:hypothetical protein KIL84_022266, partial [Mauremys mutica]
FIVTHVATTEDIVPHCLGLLGTEGAAVVAKIEREVKAACFKQLFYLYCVVSCRGRKRPFLELKHFNLLSQQLQQASLAKAVNLLDVQAPVQVEEIQAVSRTKGMARLSVEMWQQDSDKPFSLAISSRTAMHRTESTDMDNNFQTKG